MRNASYFNFENNRGQQNIMGNGNQINVGSCQQFTLNIMGNGNNIHINNSTVRLNVTGNGNRINANYSNGQVYLNGNGNNFSSCGGNLAIKGSNGNGNSNGNMNFSMPMNLRNNQMNSFFNGVSFQNNRNPFANQMFFGNGVIIGSSNVNRNISNRNFQQNYHNPPIQIIQPNNEGLQQKDLQKLPKTLCRGKDQPSCIVCMQQFRSNQYETYLFCFHKFHHSCIIQWLKKKAECPVCQMNVKQYL